MHPRDAAHGRRDLFKWVNRIRQRAGNTLQSTESESPRNSLKEVAPGKFAAAVVLLWRGSDHCFSTMIVRREHINSFRLVRSLRLRRWLILPGFAFLRHLTVDSEFLLCIFFTPSARQGSRKAIVCTGIPGLQLDRGLKRWDRFRESLSGEQRSTQAQTR